MSKFTRALAVISICGAVASSSGCLTCCAPNYEMFPAYGGAWERTNRTHGRVGSIFEPAGVLVAQNAATATEPEELQPTEPERKLESDLEPLELPPLPEGLQPAEPATPLDGPQLQTEHLDPGELLEQAGGAWSVHESTEAQPAAMAEPAGEPITGVPQDPPSGPRLLPAMPDNAAKLYQPLR